MVVLGRRAASYERGILVIVPRCYALNKVPACLHLPVNPFLLQVVDPPSDGRAEAQSEGCGALEPFPTTGPRGGRWPHECRVRPPCGASHTLQYPYGDPRRMGVSDERGTPVWCMVYDVWLRVGTQQMPPG